VERDEMGELEEAFNDMTNNLRVAQEELQYLANSLEVKVEERTRQIQHIQGQLVRSEKLASLGELVAGIAHEINNPLTGIMVFSSLALENPRLHPGLRPDIETIFRETQRCAGIVQGLLEFSREATPEKGQESVNNILEKALRLLENQAGFHDIVIHRQLDPNLPKILVDANQLNQVFINIILNAAQAMSGGGELTLTTGLDEARHQLFVRVRDTGCGIPQENIKRIFDPFFTTKEQGGTGLGLSVSYGIIENHGGTIEVESEEGKGTTFVVILPLEPAQNQPGSAAEKWVTRESQPAKTPPAGDHS
jgi:two-component system NtrC family sensor kinase